MICARNTKGRGSWGVEGQRGEGRRRCTERDVFARSKEGRILGIYMYFPFVCDPLDAGGGIRSVEGNRRREKEEKGKRKWSRGAMEVDLRHRRRRRSPLLSVAVRMLASFRLSSRFQKELTTWKLEPLPSRSYFCKALFFRNAGPTIVFPVPPLRSSSLCSIPSIWSRYIRKSLFLSLSPFVLPHPFSNSI